MSFEALPADRDALLASLRETDLADEIVAHLAAQARPAVLLVTSPAEEDDIALGASKIGGRPDLPPGMAWPTRPPYPDAARRAERHRQRADRLLADSKKLRSWMSPEQGERFYRDRMACAASVATEFPLAFLAQIELSDLAPQPGFDAAFPAEGRLLVFYDIREMPEEYVPAAEVGWRVLWDRTPAAELVRAPVPPVLASISGDDWSCVFRAAPVSARSVITPIPPNDKSWDAFPLDDDDALEVYEEWLSGFGRPDMKDRDNHQFGGFPQPLQNGLQARSQLAANGVDCGYSDVWETDAAKALLEAAKDWRLVLQIGVDANAGIPQPGAYYVMMREQDIAARRFDLARVTYQCD